MLNNVSRRQFIKSTAQFAAGVGLMTATERNLFADNKKPLYEISLAEWSLHKTIFGKKLDHLDFAKVAKEDCGIDAIEYVNQMFKTKAKDSSYLNEMKKRADGYGVKSLLIMIDGEGRLGDPDAAKRTKAVENHYKWVDAAKALGCHSIRVNASSGGTYEESQKLAADGLRRLAEFGGKQDINVIVENHGGLSSNGEWLAGVMKMVGDKRCGTLPDFGNFRVGKDDSGKDKWYDRYKGVKELMPFAKAVSAKSHDFDADGNETKTDYRRMMKIVVDAGYKGYVGIEYEGNKLDEIAGILATKKLLETVRGELSKS